MSSPLQPFLEPANVQQLAGEALTWLFTPAGQLLLASPSAQQLSLLSDPNTLSIPSWLQQVIEKVLASNHLDQNLEPQVEQLRVALATEVVHIPLTLELQWLADVESEASFLLVTGSYQDSHQNLFLDWQQLQSLEVQRLSHKVGHWSWNRSQADEFLAPPHIYTQIGRSLHEPFTLTSFLQHCHSSLESLQANAISLGNQRSHYLWDFPVKTAHSDRWFECHCLLHHDETGELISLVGNIRDITEEHHILSLVQDSETRFQVLIESNPNGILVLDEQGAVLFANHVAEQVFDQSLSELQGKYLGLPLTLNVTVQLDLVQPDGSLRYVEVSIVPIPWQQSKAYLALLTDITSLQQTQQRLKLLQEATENSPASILITSAEGIIEYVNPAFELMTGYGADEVIGKNPRFLKSGLMSPSFYQDLWETITAGETWRGELYNRRKTGELFWDRTSISPVKDLAGQIIHFVAVKEDITEQKRNRELLDHQANYDSLTDLPNRSLALDRLRQATALSERSNDTVIVMLLDLDRFKNINNTLGHSYGDCLLQEIAKRLRYHLPREITISRLGGDEFLIICPAVKENIHLKKLSQQLLKIISQPITIEAEELVITASIGVACYPNDGVTPEVLMRNADTAMYSAKRNGGNDFQLFMPTMNAEAHARIQLETHLRHALEQYQLKVFYQPIISLQDNHVVGLEALARWHDPELGNIPPDRFIPIAEETGLIIPLGYRVIEQACQDVAIWQQKYNYPFWVAVNLSPRQLRSNRFTQITAKILQRHNFRPNYLKLEVTEQMLLDNTSTIAQMLDTLHRKGIALALDDFGTGYSALSYLRRYPFQSLKVDQSFLRDIPHSTESCALVKTIVAMAHGLGMQAVAEGVETAEQVEFLKAIGCEYGQGYWFSRPLPAVEIDSFLAASTGHESIS